MPRATIGIISIGEMGVGVAKLLAAHDFEVLTNVSDRSQATQKRAADASIAGVSSDVELVRRCDYILSIVPPRDAVSTADRFIKALQAKQNDKVEAQVAPLYYLDLNAIAPSTAKTIAKAFEPLIQDVRLIDGSIIGGPPVLKETAAHGSTTDSVNASPISTSWKKPSILLSGPHPLSGAAKSGADLEQVLGSRHMNEEIGAASGLKCCFASLSKGFTGLCYQSFSTAYALGVLPDLVEVMGRQNSQSLQRARGSLPGSVTKAGRWVEEMNEIAKTFREDGGWSVAEEGRQEGLGGVFDGIAEVFRTVAKDPLLGKETIENRKRGRTLDDAVECLVEGSLRAHKRRAKDVDQS